MIFIFHTVSEFGASTQYQAYTLFIPQHSIPPSCCLIPQLVHCPHVTCTVVDNKTKGVLQRPSPESLTKVYIHMVRRPPTATGSTVAWPCCSVKKLPLYSNTTVSVSFGYDNLPQMLQSEQRTAGKPLNVERLCCTHTFPQVCTSYRLYLVRIYRGYGIGDGNTCAHGPTRNCVSPRISRPQHRISPSKVTPQTCLEREREPCHAQCT